MIDMNINIICKDIFKRNNNLTQNLNDYFENNRHILDAIYFSPKKINSKYIKEKLTDEAYLNKVKLVLTNYSNIDLNEYINKTIEGFILDTKYQIDSQEIYVIIGLNTTTIYSTKYNDELITVILLESTTSIEYLKMLLAHEFTHWVRSKYIDHDIFETCIGERFATEGIACAYSKEQTPNKEDYEYCIVSDYTMQWCIENRDLLDSITKGSLNEKTKMEMFFYMYAKNNAYNMPVRVGYVYGYLKILDYINFKRLNVKDILTIDWEEIFYTEANEE